MIFFNFILLPISVLVGYTTVSLGDLFQYWNQPVGIIWHCFHNSYLRFFSHVSGLDSCSSVLLLRWKILSYIVLGCHISRVSYNFVSCYRVYETQTGVKMKILRINSRRADCFAFCTNASSVCVSESVFILQNCPSHGFVFLLKLILRSNKNFSQEVSIPASHPWDPTFKCHLFDRLPWIRRLFLCKDNTWRNNEIFIMKLGFGKF
jgi:hypothetical protein